MQSDTHRSLAAEARAPWRRGVDDAEVLLHAVGTRGGLRDEMRRRRIRALDLDEALGADRLVAAARVVDVVRVVLVARHEAPERATTEGTHQETDRALDSAPVHGGLWVAHGLFCGVAAPVQAV